MPYQLQVPLRPALDAPWFDALEQAAFGLNEIYTVLGPSPAILQQLRSQFIASGRTNNPCLRPLHFDVNVYRRQYRQLEQLMQQIAVQEPHAAVVRAYTAHITEALEHINLLLAAESGDDAAFLHANQIIYGSPRADTFTAAYAWLRSFLLRQTNHPLPLVSQSARQANDQLDPTITSAVTLLPEATVFERVRALHYAPGGYFSSLLEGCPTIDQPIITAVTGDAVLRRVLANIGSNYRILDSPDHLWGIVHKHRAIVRPADYALDYQAFYGLVAHELGSHLLERSNGLRQPLRLLARGLDRYDHCNEGRAFLREQIGYDSPAGMTDGEEWQSHILLHVAIGLASGLHQSHKYTFAELYHVLYPAALTWALLRQADADLATEQAHTYTWNILVRCLKGTDGVGGAYLKDTIYLDGTIRCWQVAAQDPTRILFGDNGKFDISRSDHLSILAELQIGVAEGQ